MNGLPDFPVPGTSADISGNGTVYLLLSGVGVMKKKRLGGHYHAAGAESALNSTFFDKSLLDGIQLTVLFQSFNGQQLAVLQLSGNSKAGMDGLSV